MFRNLSYSWITAIAIAMGACSWGAIAQRPGAQPPQPAPPMQPGQPGQKPPIENQNPANLPITVNGRITGIQGDNGQFGLRTADGKTLNFAVNPQTRFRLKDRDVRFLDFADGANVTVVYDVVEGKHVVRSLGDTVVAEAGVSRVADQANRFAIRTADGRELVLQIEKDVRIIDMKDGSEVIIVYDAKGGKQVIVASTGGTAGVKPVDPVKPPPLKDPPPPGVVGAGQPVRGRIGKVEAEARIITLKKEDGKELFIHVTETATIRIGDKDLKLSDLKEGTEVVVDYEIKDDKYMANSIKNIPLKEGDGPKKEQPPK